MKNLNASEQLKERIRFLEIRQSEQIQGLKEELNASFESLKPTNFVKNIFHELFSPPDGKNDIVNSIVGMISGFVTRKVLVGHSKNPLKKLAASVAQIALSNGLAKNADNIIDKGVNIFKKIFPFKKKHRYAYASEENGTVTNS